jgi:hypothetical protein
MAAVANADVEISVESFIILLVAVCLLELTN